MRDIAEAFGESLDQDDFETTKDLLSTDCVYIIGKETLNGLDEICGSYESNMIEGRKKLDELVWGESQVEEISPAEFFVHFTDYLTHKGKSYIHRCKQKVTINPFQRIERIEHIHDPEEQKRLDAFYQSVGLK